MRVPHPHPKQHPHELLMMQFLVPLKSRCIAVGQGCSKDELSGAAQGQLDIYDNDLYLEPNCVNGYTPLPLHCNYMGLGQECRGCFMTCDGAKKYKTDFAAEYAVWVSCG